MKTTLKLMGVLIAGLMWTGCQAEDGSSTNAPGPEVSAMKTLDNALVAGRLESLPQGLTVREVAVSTSAVAKHEAYKMASKAAEVSTRPAFDPLEEGERIIEQHQRVPLAEGLSLRISLPKEDYVVGEPVIVHATIENTSDRAKHLPPLLDPQFQFNNFVVTDPSGRVLGFSPIAIACTRGHLLDETLEPGEARTQDVPVFFHKDGWMFSDIGEYSIQALYRGLTDDASRLDSNVVTLTVSPGTPEDRAAAELMMGHDQGLFVMWGQGDHLEDGIVALETLVDRYPNTTLATYARYALGSNMAQDFTDGRYGLRRAVPVDALNYLLPVMNQLKVGAGPVLPEGMVKGAFEMVADAYTRLDQLDEARRVREDLTNL